MASERKKFFDVEVPVMGSVIRLYGKSIKEFDKRFIKVDLTRNLRGKSLEATFIVNVEGNKAIAEPKQVLLLSSFIRRMVRDAISYVEDSFETECVDALLRVKTFQITRKKVPRSVRKAIREASKKYLIEELRDKTREEIITDIVNNKIQKPLSLRLKKIYPLSLCEIRELKIIKNIEGRTKPVKEKVEEKESIDQVAELKIQPEEAREESLDQMKEVEEALAIRAKELEARLAQEKTMPQDPSAETVEKPESKEESETKDEIDKGEEKTKKQKKEKKEDKEKSDGKTAEEKKEKIPKKRGRKKKEEKAGEEKKE